MNRKNPCVVEGHINKLINKEIEPLTKRIILLENKIDNICKNSSNNIYNDDNMNDMNNSNDNKQLTAISLFSGMGGDSLAMTNCGFKLVAYSEIIKAFRDTHELNFKQCKSIGAEVKHNIIKVKDKELLDYKGKIDMIFAGFPCQGFSNAGKKDVNDPRNTLFREFLRTAKLIEPDYIIGENVKGLLSRKTSDNQNYIDIIVNEFKELDYNVKYKVFKTYKYGIPQKRERLVIFGIKKHLKKDVKFPEELTTKPDLKNIIKFDMKGSIRIKKEDFDMSKIPKECILTDMENEEDENEPHPYLKLKAKERDTEYSGKVHKTLLSFAKRDSPIHCEIIDIRNPSKTIICTYNHQPRLFVPLLNKNGYYLRCILPDELKQIQGFPADFEICGTNKEKIIQIGNAVPPPLIEQIIKANI
tara:strand:+ start:450 stop:1694 length:1245 start_codon:yes stop_codon:yes gene_type:complete